MAFKQKLLSLLTPLTGRKIKEDGTFFYEADALFENYLLDPQSVVLRKQGYFTQHLRLDVAANNIHYYRFKAPSDKHAVIYTREINAGEGPVKFETLINPDSYTAGTMITPVNLFTGGPVAKSEFESLTVAPVGGLTIPADYLFGAGNKAGTASRGASLPTILPPSTEIFVKITNESDGINPGIRFAIAFGEIDIPEILVI